MPDKDKHLPPKQVPEIQAPRDLPPKYGQLDHLVAGSGERWGRFLSVIAALRPHQWAKNLLVFVPVVTSHELLDGSHLLSTLIAYVAFCLCASAVYVINDILDVRADRLHPMKRHRPFASGALPLHWGPFLALPLIALGLGIPAVLLAGSFTTVLVLYALTAILYSLVLKRIVMLDVVTLACLYTVRVLGGGLATGILVSEWLIAFALFIFLSLAFAKRYTELAHWESADEAVLPGRSYRLADLSLIESMGPACGLLSALILALYIQSDQVKKLYSHPEVLWLLCPLLIYWVARLWVRAKRRELTEDPVVFAVRDPVSLIVAAIAVALLVMGARE